MHGMAGQGMQTRPSISRRKKQGVIQEARGTKLKLDPLNQPKQRFYLLI